MFIKKTNTIRVGFVMMLVVGLTFTSCKDSSTSAVDENEITAAVQSLDNVVAANQTTNVFKSDGSVITYDVILPAEPGYPHSGPGRWQDVVCKDDGSGSIGLNAGWNRSEGQTAFEVGTHPWESNFYYNWDAAWINAVETINSVETYNGYTPGDEADPDKSGPEDGQNWTRYDMEIQGSANETYKLQLLADNCSWIYLDGQMVGYQDDSDVGGLIEYGVTTNGDLQTLTFIIWDGNGLAGGKFRMETTIEDIPEFEPPASENTAPVADAGEYENVEATGTTNNSVTLDGSGSSDPDEGDELSYSWEVNGVTVTGETAEVALPIGTHTVTLTVTDQDGASNTDTATIIVEDTTAPVLNVNQQVSNLWPPNHKMVLVASISATDVVDENPTISVDVSSSESSNGRGDGNTDSDYDIVTKSDGTVDVYVRSERSGKGNGRTYFISVTATDGYNNSSSDSFEVQVAKSQGRGR